MPNSRDQALNFIRFVKKLKETGDGRFKVSGIWHNIRSGSIDYYLYDPNSNINIGVSDQAFALLSWSKEYLDHVWSNGESLDEAWFSLFDVREIDANAWRSPNVVRSPSVRDNTSLSGGDMLNGQPVNMVNRMGNPDMIPQPLSQPVYYQLQTIHCLDDS